MQMEPGVSNQPTLHSWNLVGLIVVEDEVDVEIVGDGLIDGVEELAEFNGAVPLVTFGDDLTGLGVESREERSGILGTYDSGR